jgi:hypothetical protein
MNLLMWRHLEVEVDSWKDEHKTYFWKQETKFDEVYVKYDHLVDFIRHDPAEIRKLLVQTPLAVSAWVERPLPVFSCL